MKKSFLLLITFFLFASVKSQIKYSEEKFSDAKKMHKRVVSITPNFMLKHNVKKLQIIEYTADISISDKILSWAFPISGNFEEYYKSKHKNYAKEIGENYYETALDVFYNRFNTILSDNGLFPTEKKKITKNPVYIKNNLSKTGYKKYDGSEQGTFIDNTNCSISTSGMNPLPKGLDYNTAEVFNEDMAHVAHDNEVHAALKIHLGLKVDGNGIIVITKYTVLMDTWLAAYKKGEETRYKWKVIDSELFSLKNEIQGSINHQNLDSLDDELVSIISYVTEMFSYALSSYL